MAPVLEATELECERGGRRLFRGLSFSLEGGELLRVAGPNGSGKTSLLRILCGLLAPSAGAVRWRGEPIERLREDYAKELVYLGHAPAVKDELTPSENLQAACAIAGRPAPRAAIGEALARFGLEGLERPVKRLSQGQRRRAALARLLLSEAAPLWLLDEPLAALDAGAAAMVESLIAAQVARGGAVAYTTHQEARIEAAVARVVDLAAA